MFVLVVINYFVLGGSCGYDVAMMWLICADMKADAGADDPAGIQCGFVFQC